MASLSAIAFTSACSGNSSDQPSAAEKKTIADSIKSLVVSTYDLSKPDVVKRFMALYPDTGAVVSAGSGNFVTTRPAVQTQIETFWKYVGSNMRNPKWEWTAMRVDVLSRDVAVMTATYRIPHTTPMGMAHVIGGAWTAVFSHRGGRWVIVDEHLSDSPNP
jgi:Calcium/calmodulin dependent protein kinase II Association.